MFSQEQANTSMATSHQVFKKYKTFKLHQNLQEFIAVYLSGGKTSFFLSIINKNKSEKDRNFEILPKILRIKSQIAWILTRVFFFFNFKRNHDSEKLLVLQASMRKL